MGFWSEIKESIQDGLEEGKAEARAELAEQDERKRADAGRERAELMRQIERIPYEEKFFMCLAAPFRIICFYDWFTLWDDDDEEDLRYPLHLYTFGDGIDLKPADVKNLGKQIKRDCGIRDRKTAILRIRELLDSVGITANDPLFSAEDPVRSADPDITRGLRILYSSIAALAVTGSVDAGYLTKNEVMPALTQLNELVRSTFPHENSDWNAFADAFLMEEELAGLNNDKGRKILTQFVGYLKTKAGSPWNNVPFHPF